MVDRTWPILSYYCIKNLGFHAIDDVVADPRYQMAIGEHVNV